MRESLASRHSTCGRWQKTQIPCDHAITVIRRLPGRGSALGPSSQRPRQLLLGRQLMVPLLLLLLSTILRFVENCQPPTIGGFLAAGLEMKDFARRTLAVLAGGKTKGKLACSYCEQLMPPSQILCWLVAVLGGDPRHNKRRCRQPHD